MKNIIRFSRLFIPTIIFSAVLLIAGITSYFLMGGFYMGVDFQAGHIFEIQFAPTAFTVTWSGGGNARMAINEDNISISTGSGTNLQTYVFSFDNYRNLSALTEAISEIDGISIQFSEGIDPETVESKALIRSAQGDPTLERPRQVHYMDTESQEIYISEVREALSGIEENVVIQNIGRSQDHQFMIRIEAEEEVVEIQKEEIFEEREGYSLEDFSDEEDFDEEDSDEIDFDEKIIDNEFPEGLSDIPLIFKDAAMDEDETDTIADKVAVKENINAGRIIGLLEDSFGEGEILILRSDYVHPRFSSTLAGQAILLMFYTLMIILAYSAVRFKPRFAIGAVAALLHDALVIVAFIVWSGLEFNTTTIAAILTILGYSINNTIVIFDRVRENRRIYPDELFENIINRSITDTLSRTIITTLTTMIAVLSLIIFTTGSMRDFAIILQVGMISGVYTSIFIANGVVNLFEKGKIVREKKKAGALGNKITKKAPSRA